MCRREAGLGEALHLVEHAVDVDGAALDRALVAEQLDPLDELHDAVGLVADEAGQQPVALVGGLLEELRRAADAGQRVLDLVRQHRAERRDRARGAAMGELPVHLVGDGALLEHQHDDVAVLAEGVAKTSTMRSAAEPRRCRRRRGTR